MSRQNSRLNKIARRAVRELRKERYAKTTKIVRRQDSITGLTYRDMTEPFANLGVRVTKSLIRQHAYLAAKGLPHSETVAGLMNAVPLFDGEGVVSQHSAYVPLKELDGL